MTHRATTLATLSAALSLVGCFGDRQDGPLGSAVAEVQIVPAGVGCIRVAYRSATATADTTRNLGVTAGAATTLDLGYLAAGAYSFRASAFNLACGSVVAATVPTWVGEPVSATVTPGYATTVPITLRLNVPTRTSVDFFQPARAIFSGLGSQSTYAIMADGSVRAWGRNDYGQLGDGTTASATTPRVVAGIVDPVQIAGAATFACATSTNRGLYCWGNNFGGQFTDGTREPSLTPRNNPDVEPDSIAVGGDRLCGLFGRAVACWGAGLVPATAGRTDAAAIALDQQGDTLWTVTGAGRAYQGPTNLAANLEFNRERVTDLAIGGTSRCYLTGGRTVVCSGENFFGQLGDGTTTETLAERGNDLREVTGLTAGYLHTCALRYGGSVWCWGQNSLGEIGAGLDEPFVSTPLAVPLPAARQIAAGNRHTCALLNDGSVWCWGDNEYGQLGDGTNTSRFTPVRVRF